MEPYAKPLVMSLLSNLWNKGELPTVTTEVTFSTATLVQLAVAVILVTFIIMLSAKLLKRF